MNQDNFKKILDEALEPINNKLDNHDKTLESINNKLDSHSEKIDSLSEKLDSHDKTLESINNKLDNHSGALISIESKLDGYGDMYKINNGNAKKLEKRIEVLENQSGITPPPEFTLVNTQ